MTLFTRTLLTATILVGTTWVHIAPAHAGCGGSRRSYVPSYRPPVQYYQQPVYRAAPQPIIQQPPVVQPAPQQSVPSTPGASTSGQQPTRPQNGTNSTRDAQLSALQMLAGMAEGQTTGGQAKDQQPQRSEVGTWKATLAGGARVQLELRADGTFTWSATTKEGRSSNFSGAYTLTNGQLVLTRSNDNQQLSGNLARSGDNNFSFQLAGAKDGGLNFVRV